MAEPACAEEASTRELPLLRWLWQPTEGTGIRFATGQAGWEHWSYPQLAAASHGRARTMIDAGLRPGDIVLVVEPTGPGFVTGCFGAMLAGAVPTPASPPLFGQDQTQYRDLLRSLVRATRPRLVLTTRRLAEIVRRAVPAEPAAPVVLDDHLCAEQDGGRVPPVRPADLALLQLTSGSTGRPRGVRVPFDALQVQLNMIGNWLRIRPQDPTASWLPLHHDMGLIGCLLTPVVNQTDLWLLSPEQFIRQPLRYLRCFGESGAHLTAMPTFGLAHILRRVGPSDLDGLDFSRWRAVIVGAERVAADILEAFAALLAPQGFRREALLPAYGLAEATLAVSGSPLDEIWITRTVSAHSLSLGRAPEPAGDGPVSTIAGCGRPLPGVRVTLVDENGLAQPDGQVGEIVVAGRSVAAGYHGAAEPGSTRFGAPGLSTGDAGFLSGGQLFVLGRLGDSIKLRGRTLFAEDVEAALETMGVPRHRQAVLLGVHHGGPVAVLMVERADPGWLGPALGEVARLTEGADVIALHAGVGTIARTTSGKPRRRELWQRFVAGDLDDMRSDIPSPPRSGAH